jgi:hypothetical protein
LNRAQHFVQRKSGLIETDGLARLGKCPHDHVQDIIRTVSADDLLRREAMEAAQFFPEFKTHRVGVDP